MGIAEILKIIVALVNAIQETVTVQMVALVSTVNVDPLS